MIFFRKPSPSRIQQFLDDQATLEFTYANVGATAHTPPPGFVVDHRVIKLGKGLAVFEAARKAIQLWQQFQLGWVEPANNQQPILKGEVVGVLARSMGLWWLNACRIVYVVNEQLPHRFGFAYGTLPGHAECGEERFLIELDEAQQVSFEILAFSRPQFILARLGYPYVRHIQKTFAKHATERLKQCVDEKV